jgi:ferredoxin
MNRFTTSMFSAGLCFALVSLSGCDLSVSNLGDADRMPETQLTPRPALPEGQYYVRLIHPQGDFDVTIVCSDNEYILDCAEANSVDLPYDTRSGAEPTDAAKIISGSVDQGDQSYLTQSQMDQGYVLLSVAYPMSDLDILTHQQSEVE